MAEELEESLKFSLTMQSDGYKLQRGRQTDRVNVVQEVYRSGLGTDTGAAATKSSSHGFTEP